ncbi:MAG: hypothetical protein ACRDOG_06950 [Gaiellaceae bacterium]
MKALALVSLAAAFLAGCGGNGEPADDDAGSPRVSGIAAGPGISIEEALASELDEMLLVNGNLLAEGGDVRLCSALAESFPPQCGGASLLVEGLKLEEVDGLVTEGDVSWTDRPTQLLGVVEDGVLTVSQNATA